MYRLMIMYLFSAAILRDTQISRDEVFDGTVLKSSRREYIRVVKEALYSQAFQRAFVYRCA